MNTQYTAAAEVRAQPLDLDKLPRYYMGSMDMQQDPSGKYVHIDDLLALLAQARTAKVDTTASASIEPRKMSWLDAPHDIQNDHASAWAKGWNACRATLAPVAAQQAAPSGKPTAWLATDLDGRGDVAFTQEEAKRRAGEGCTHFYPLYEPSDIAAPATAGAATTSEDADRTEVRQAIRKVLKHHKLTKHGDGVVEADLAHAVIGTIKAMRATQQEGE